MAAAWNRETTCAGLMLEDIDFTKTVKGYRARNLSESEARKEIEPEIRKILDQTASKVAKAVKSIPGSEIFVNYDLNIDYKALAADVIDTYWQDIGRSEVSNSVRLSADDYRRFMNELPPLTIPKAALESVSPPCTSGFMSSETVVDMKTGHTLHDAYGERIGPDGRPEYLYLGLWTIHGESLSSSRKRSRKALFSKRRS